LAKRRIIRANGFENNPIISTGIITGRSQKGTPGVANICFQYALFPLNCVTRKGKNERKKVIEIFPVTLARMGEEKESDPLNY